MSFVVPAFSATNPFMDVPMNHWAYDAIGQLAAHGILSGYPDGMYKGQQQTTRYELASALARALAVVDMTKASKQDVEMLKRLVVEFKDELEALGVRVDELDERVAVLEDRLGGWHIHGTLVLDVVNRSANDAGDSFGPDGDGSIGFDEARLFFERTFGENDEYFFRARLRNEEEKKTNADDDVVNGAYFDRFYVEMPFFFDSRLMVGRNNWAWEGDYKISLPETGGWTGGQLLTDWTWTGFGLTKNFGLGTVQAAFAHPNKNFGMAGDGETLSDWMVMARGSFQFTEQIGFDIGGQAFVGDNAEERYKDDAGVWQGMSFNNLWTAFAGVRFNFNDNIAFKGTFYHQQMDSEFIGNSNGRRTWLDRGYGLRNAAGNYIDVDDANHWAAIIDVKQAALKYTSVWLEYGQYDQGFRVLNSDGIFYSDLLKRSQAAEDIKYWRVGLGQEWNDKWATYLFYYGYNRDIPGGDNIKPAEYGVGVQYKLNDATTMGLNYMHADNDQDGNNSREDNVVRFRTSVTF
ncbi:MAG: S-layer homology domain-containing protein [Synergistaceae bacterium]|nr:S-layer homology domain-containing protein [Synergistaceae bacterium]